MDTGAADIHAYRNFSARAVALAVIRAAAPGRAHARSGWARGRPAA